MSKKILLFLDNLTSGGAQRQMCMLAPLLKEYGYAVEMLTYFPHDFFAHLLQESGIPWRVIPWKNKLGRIITVRKALREARPDVVIAYLKTPSMMAELAMWPDRPFKLIVSERSATLNPGCKDRIYYNFHRLADAVVPNSYSQQRVLEKEAPYLKDKIHTIINCVDLIKFKTADRRINNNPVKILVVGSFKTAKNPLGLCEALKIIRDKKKSVEFQVHWYGNNFFLNGKPSPPSEVYLKVLKKIGDYQLGNVLQLYNPVQDIIPLYQSADVLCLPSFYEGCPNVLAEAMACGKPVLAGNVCDNPLYVKDGHNGLLFDPKDPGDIAEVLLKFLAMTTDQKTAMGIQSRQIVEERMSPQVFVGQYIKLIKRLLGENG